jgi:TRAP-type mannitol/chloroaromatic compound transport system permease small subunit
MLDTISKGIDAFSRKQGEVTSMLIIPLLLVVIYEVFMRYAFNQPTTWGFEMTGFLYGLHYMFGLSYTDVNDGHVRVDIFTARFSKKTQYIIGIVTILLLFMPVMTPMVIWATKYAITSVANLERNSTSWAPPIWPYKCLMALAFFFLWLQGLSNLLKNIRGLRSQN